MTNFCGPVNSIKSTKLLGLCCSRSLPCVSGEKKLQKRTFLLLCQLSPLLWDVFGMVISCGSVRVFCLMSTCILWLFSLKKPYCLRSLDIMKLEMLLIKAYFACKLSVWAFEKMTFFNSNLNSSAELKILSVEHTETFKLWG